jgi:CelD/BcsL family acetyltransferase involved in cellulose biosynthesis
MIEIIDRVSELTGLEEDWHRLGSLFPTPLLQYEWFLTCAETLHREDDLRVVVLRSGGRVTAIAPLVVLRQGAVRWLEIIGVRPLHEPSGVLFEDNRALERLINAVLRLGYPLHLSRVRADSPIHSVLRAHHPLSSLVLTHPTASSCYLSFRSSDWSSVYASIGSSWRKRFRRCERRAKSLGCVSVDTSPPSPETLGRDLALAMQIETSGWKGRVGTALAGNAKLRTFFERYAARACANGTLRLYFYRVNGEAVAMRLGVEFARRLWFLKIGYDEKWRQLSPGMQLALGTIQHACETGLEGYEFLGSEEAWQHAWPVRTHAYCSDVAYPWSIAGAFGAVDTLVKYAQRRLVSPASVLAGAPGPRT